MTPDQTPSPVVTARKPLGFSILTLIGLAALALPRVLLHDLHLIPEGNSLVSALLTIGPVVIWITLAVVRRVPNPFLTVLVIGSIFGLMLVITHQLLWDVAFGGNPPTIGDAARGTLLPRIASIPSGLFTGAILGAIGGLVAWGVQAVTRRTRAAE